MTEPAILTIGHSNHPIEQFLRLVKEAGVRLIADVRSFPISRYAPQFNKEALANSLQNEGIAYIYLGKELGGRAHERPSMPLDFENGLRRVIEESASRRIAMMCAERDPLDCHRGLLLSRRLAEKGIAIGHILASGNIEIHRETEDRLLEAEGLAGEDFFPREQRLVDAYNSRSGLPVHTKAAGR